MRVVRFSLVLAVAAGCVCNAAGAASSSIDSPWRAGAAVREAAFDARSQVEFGDQADAKAAAARAVRIYRRALRPHLRRSAPDFNRAALAALNSLVRAVEARDSVAVASAQGAAWAAILGASAKTAIEAAGAGDVKAADRWLLLRDFRTATRFTRPATDATEAISQLRDGKLTANAAMLAVRKELLDTYQARLRELQADVATAVEKGFSNKAAEYASQANGYWQILRTRFRADLGDKRLSDADAAFENYRAAVADGDAELVADTRTAIEAEFDGFVAAPMTAREEARRAQQLFRFLELVPFEYEQGVKDGRVTADFEIQEGVGFRNGAEAAFDDLKGKLSRRDQKLTAEVDRALEELRLILKKTQERTEIAPPADVEQLAMSALNHLKAEVPPAWTAHTDESDFDLIALTLDRMDTAVRQGQWTAAEQARLETYAFLEFGPELKLRAFDPHLALELEGLIWFGARGEEGLAKLIANHAPRTELKSTRLALDESLKKAKATLGEDQSATTAIVNGAILVFREGLEAVLILAAITASMIGVMTRRRRAVLIGAALGLVLSIVTWGVAQLVIGQLGKYGEKLEAVVGVIAIAVLLYVMNWFFHKVYWTEHIRKFHDRRRRLVGDSSDSEEHDARVGFWSAQAIGFALLGLSSVYREGFETVLFLQSLQLATDTGTVVLGALLGLVLTGAVAVVTFRLQRKLPYKRMLIVTGVLLALVLFTLVGNTVRSLQGVGWVPVTPIDFEPPLWAGTWFGIFPSWQSIGAQLIALTLVVGSYFLAEEIRVKRPTRRALRLDQASSTEAAPS